MFRVAPQQCKSFFVACWYRLPIPGIDTLAFNKLTIILKNLDNEEMEIILIGNTNCDLKATGNSNTKSLKLISTEYQSKQLINSCSRFAVTHDSEDSMNVSKTLIVHFSAKKASYIIKTDIIEN